MLSFTRTTTAAALLVGALHLHPGARQSMAQELEQARALLAELKRSTHKSPPPELALRPDEARLLAEAAPPTLEEAVPGIAVVRAAGVPLLVE